MKKQKTPKPEKGKINKDTVKRTELQKNGSQSDVPEMETNKNLLKIPLPSKEQPVEKDVPKNEQSVN